MLSGGGSSHNFIKYYGEVDAKGLHETTNAAVRYDEDFSKLQAHVAKQDILMLTNNQKIPNDFRDAIFKHFLEGKSMMINHASTWYNWRDWPEYNQNIVGGGSRSHEKLGEFKVIIKKPEHPIMKGVKQEFLIIDELYRWQKAVNAEIEVLAVGKGLTSAKEYPIIWIVKNKYKAKVVCNTLGHDNRAHDHEDYKKILTNTANWLLEKN